MSPKTLGAHRMCAHDTWWRGRSPIFKLVDLHFSFLLCFILWSYDHMREQLIYRIRGNFVALLVLPVDLQRLPLI